MLFIGRGDLRSPAGVHRTPLRLWRFEAVHGFASVGNLYQKMHFAGSNLSTDPKTAQSAEMHLQNFEKLQSRKLLVKYSAYAECEIIHFVNCEILLLRRNVK